VGRCGGLCRRSWMRFPSADEDDSFTLCCYVIRITLIPLGQLPPSIPVTNETIYIYAGREVLGKCHRGVTKGVLVSLRNWIMSLGNWIMLVAVCDSFHLVTW
jgi:hypothetical protein